MPDHDQRFKVLLQLFPEDFFRLFFPDWASQFDFSRVEWLATEMFPDPPEGRRRAIDLVAKLPFRPRTVQPGASPVVEPAGANSVSSSVRELLALIHLEVESAESVAAFRQRMFWYYVMLRQRHDLPVLPVALFLRAGLDGIGRDEYAEDFGTTPVLKFWYHYAGLRQLEGEGFLPADNRIAPALVGFMKLRSERKPFIKAQAADFIRLHPTTEQQKFLVLDSLETYLELSASEQVEFDKLLQTSDFQETREMIHSTFDRVREQARQAGIAEGWQAGRQEGRQEGLQEGRERASREMILSLLQHKFGPISEDVRRKVAQVPAADLVTLLYRISQSESIDAVGL